MMLRPNLTNWGPFKEIQESLICCSGNRLEMFLWGSGGEGWLRVVSTRATQLSRRPTDFFNPRRMAAARICETTLTDRRLSARTDWRRRRRAEARHPAISSAMVAATRSSVRFPFGCRPSTGPWFVDEARCATLDEARTPLRDRLCRNPLCLRHLLVAQAVGTGQDDAASPSERLGGGESAHPPLQGCPLFVAQVQCGLRAP